MQSDFSENLGVNTISKADLTTTDRTISIFKTAMKFNVRTKNRPSANMENRAWHNQVASYLVAVGTSELLDTPRRGLDLGPANALARVWVFTHVGPPLKVCHLRVS